MRSTCIAHWYNCKRSTKNYLQIGQQIVKKNIFKKGFYTKIIITLLVTYRKWLSCYIKYKIIYTCIIKYFKNYCY